MTWPLYLSSITSFELELGVLQLERKGQGRKLRVWLDSLLRSFSGRILPYDVESSLLCARMHSPDPKALRNSMIAAIAIRHDCTLVTRNTRDFARIDVPVFNPWQGDVLQEPGLGEAGLFTGYQPCPSTTEVPSWTSPEAGHFPLTTDQIASRQAAAASSSCV